MDENGEIKLRYLLKELGLSSFEQNAYIFLLNLGSASAREISEDTNVPITRVYSVMKQLEEKKLIRTERFSNPVKYHMKPPESSLRILHSKYSKSVTDETEKLNRLLDDFVNNAGFKSSPKSYWEVYQGSDTVYRLVIPSLVKASKSEVLIMGTNITQTLTKEFLFEFNDALDKGIVFKCLGPAESSQILLSIFESLKKVLGLMKLATIMRRHMGTNLIMRKNNLDNIIPFGVFDKSKVGFSITSPFDGRYLVTLVTNAKDVVDDFLEMFQNLWETSEDFKLPLSFLTHAREEISTESQLVKEVSQNSDGINK